MNQIPGTDVLGGSVAKNNSLQQNHFINMEIKHMTPTINILYFLVILFWTMNSEAIDLQTHGINETNRSYLATASDGQGENISMLNADHAEKVSRFARKTIEEVLLMNGGIWRPLSYDVNVQRKLVGEIPQLDNGASCTPQPYCRSTEGTYLRDPYYRIFYAKNPTEEDTISMTSDRSFLATIQPIEGKPNQFHILTKDLIKGKGTLTFGKSPDNDCISNTCFVVTNMPEDSDLANGTYMPMERAPIPNNKEALLDMFTNFSSAFSFSKYCYNMKEYDPEHPGLTSCSNDILHLPPGEKSYTKGTTYDGSSIAIPFGWKFGSYAGDSNTSNKTTINGSQRDLAVKRAHTLGWKTGFNFLNIIDASVEHSKTTTSEYDNMTHGKTTNIQYKTLDKQFVLVVDKANLTLDEGFVRRIRS